MDTKWKKCKVWLGILMFCLGWSMLLHCLLTGLSQAGSLRENLSALTENDYQNTWEFHRFVENRLESFLGMATGGPVRNWNNYEYDYYDHSMFMQDGLYGYGTATAIVQEQETTAVYIDEEEANAIAAELGMEGASPEEMEDFLSSYGYRTKKRDATPEEIEYYKQQAQQLHQQLFNDKNMLYIIQYDGKTLFTNADGTSLAGGDTPSLPDGYNFFLSFDGQKTRIIKDGQEIDIYGDGYYREENDWFVPGYKNFTVDEQSAKASIVIAVARSPIMYVNGSYATTGYARSDNSLYWIERNMADNRRNTTGLLLRTGAALVLLLLSALLKKDRMAGIRQISRFTGKIWFEIKLLAAAAALTPCLLLCQDVIQTLSWVMNEYAYGYGPYWTDVIHEAMYVLQSRPALHIAGFTVLFFVLYLLTADLRFNKKPWRHGLLGKLFRQLNLKNLSIPVQRQMMYPYVVLIALQSLLLIAALFLISEIGCFFEYYSRLFPPCATLLCILLVSLAGTILFAVRGRQTARDLGALTRQIAAVKHGDLTHPSNLSEDSPLAEAARDLNEIRQGLHTALDEQIKSERMKVELVSNVSHDIKTPLTSIISYVDLLNQEEELPPHIQDYVRILDDKSQRLKAMVQDVFEVSKAASGQLPVEMEQIDFGKLLRQTLADMEEVIRNSSVSLKTSIPETPVMICADGQRLYRVFQNLIQNALQYSLEGSRVYLTLTQKQDIALAVIKNISRTELDKNVDFTARFTRGDDSRTDGGSGLGLSIAQSFTEACHGSFRVEIDADLFTVTVTFAVVEDC